jgi:hypothetical protein
MLADLDAIALEMPRIPRYELRCHPGVLSALRREFPPQGGFTPGLAVPDVIADPEMAPGRWRLLADGEVAMEGQIMT